MNIHDTIEQGTDEWHALRCGRITATSFTTMANGREGTFERLCLSTAAERLSGQSAADAKGGFTVNDAMQWGLDTEAEGRRAYELETLTHVQQVGFVSLDEGIGCSPDGLIGEDGGVEIKCPQPHTHESYRLIHAETGDAWKAYKWQIQGTLWVTGRAWWDFAFYCPMTPSKHTLLIERVFPDEDDLKKLKDGSEKARKRIVELIDHLEGK